MKPLNEYTVSFPYGATDPPYGTAALPFHRGDDYACPTGTPIIIEGTTIGLTGNTGLSSGPHCHVQEWQGSVYNTRKPQNAFKAGRVESIGTDPKTHWGLYITLTVDNWNTTYCHLSKINVKPGDIIKQEELLSMTPEVAAALKDLKDWVVDNNKKIDYVQKQLNDLKNWEVDTNKTVKEK